MHTTLFGFCTEPALNRFHDFSRGSVGASGADEEAEGPLEEGRVVTHGTRNQMPCQDD